jgi:ubiquinone/menaquinone biosynthesis C-methylase UbiE
MKEQDYYEANKKLWNAKTPVHKASSFYDVAGFRAGKTSLQATELEELTEVEGKSLLHLQCHFGLDTLSWARKGAKVTGVDFSEEAIALAQEISTEENIPARFIASNIYDLTEVLDEQFDIIYTSYGVLCWLGNIEEWARIVARYLKPGGTFYIVEHHPSWMMFEFETGDMNVAFPYFLNKEPMREKSEGTYADMSSELSGVEYFWNYPLGEVITALIQAGLQLEYVHEFPYTHYNCFPNMVELAAGEWHMKGFEKLVPLLFSIKAKKG